MYKITQHKTNVEDREVVAYGISSNQQTIYDISIDFSKVSGLVDKLNEHEVSEVHFFDVVTDFLISQ